MLFGSPWPSETRLYLEAIGNLLSGRGGAAPKKPLDHLAPFREAYQGRKKQLISMRIDGWVIELTRMMAKQHDLPYQTIFRIWIEEGLRRVVVLEGSGDQKPSKQKTPNQANL